MSAVPKELDETAYVDGYSFGRFFFKIFIPTIAAGIGITLLFKVDVNSNIPPIKKLKKN